MLSPQHAATYNVVSIIVFHGFDTVSLLQDIFIFFMKASNNFTV